MCLKHTNVVYCCVYLLCQISLFGCQVTLVKRDIIDKFRIGDQGCKGNQSVCTNVGAFCHTDSGLCQCNAITPHFRNPTITVKDGSYIYESSYGCLKTDVIQQRIGKSACITPFQLLSYDHSQSVAAFPNVGGYENCSLNNVEAKYPNSDTWHQVSWLNDTYVSINIIKQHLHFKFEVSVPDLRGLIVMVNLRCTKITSGSELSNSKCLQGKVSGTWTLDGSPTPETPKPTEPETTTKPKTTTKPEATTSQEVGTAIVFSSSTVTASSTVVPTVMPSTTLSSNNKTNQLSSTDDGPDGGIIAVAVIIPLIVVVIGIVVAWFVIKRRKRNRYGRNTQRSTSPSNKGSGQVGLNNVAYGYRKKPDEENYADPGITRNDIKVPPKETTGPKALNYMAPEKLDFNIPRSTTESSQPTEYAAIAGVLKEAGE